MQVDEKEFFREGTLRICCSLDAETFLWESFMYIRGFIPADNVYLTHYLFCYNNISKKITGRG